MELEVEPQNILALVYYYFCRLRFTEKALVLIRLVCPIEMFNNWKEFQALTEFV